MGVNDGVFVYYSLAEVQLRGTDRLHCANEREKPDSIRKKAQRGSHKMEQHLEEPSKSKCRKNDPHGWVSWKQNSLTQEC